MVGLEIAVAKLNTLTTVMRREGLEEGGGVVKQLFWLSCASRMLDDRPGLVMTRGWGVRSGEGTLVVALVINIIISLSVFTY